MIACMRAKFTARYTSYAILIQKTVAEFVAVHSQAADIREDIERCLGLVTGNLQPNKGVVNQDTPLVEFCKHVGNLV